MILDPAVPRLPGLDHTISLVREGYQFVGRRCDARAVDGVVARLQGREALCVRGLEGAGLVYGGAQVTRAGAIPTPTRHLLQDDGSVQGLDGVAHQRRRDLFLEVLGPRSADQLVGIVRTWWASTVNDWPVGVTRSLHDVANRVLTGAVLEWASLPSDDVTLSRMVRPLAAMVDHAGLSEGIAVSSLAGNWWARARRRSVERWIGDHLQVLRSRDRQPDADRSSPAARMALHCEDGVPLPIGTAAVELLNLVRPVVAVSRFVVFTAMALARHPEWSMRLADDDTPAAVAFAHEVRRTHPFFPVILTVARGEAHWGPVVVPPGTLVLFDLYGTNHHHELWPYPWAFRPERFQEPDAVDRLVPQGWGDPVSSHRCPGEPMTVRLLAELGSELARFPHRLPMQDLSLPLDRLPTLPAGGLQVTRTA